MWAPRVGFVRLVTKGAVMVEKPERPAGRYVGIELRQPWVTVVSVLVALGFVCLCVVWGAILSGGMR